MKTDIGKIAEAKAVSYLQRKNFHILCRNYAPCGGNQHEAEKQNRRAVNGVVRRGKPRPHQPDAQKAVIQPLVAEQGLHALLFHKFIYSDRKSVV